MIIRIDSVDSLRQVAAYCHDALFNANEVKYDQAKRILTLTLTRDLPERSEKVWSVLFLHRWRVCKTKSVLTLQEVSDVDIQTPDVQDFMVDISYDVLRLAAVTDAHQCAFVGLGALHGLGLQRTAGGRAEFQDDEDPRQCQDDRRPHRRREATTLLYP